MLYESTLQEFKEQLYALQQNDSAYLKQANLAIVLCRKILDVLKTSVIKHGYKSKREEIRFFRDIKMEPMRYLVYYSNMRSFELRMPKVGLVPKTNFFKRERDRVNIFFDAHINFQIYMEQGLEHSDKCYFLRKYLNEFPPIFIDDYYRDPMFNTAYDKLWATIKGFGLYGRYLDKQKKLLDVRNSIRVTDRRSHAQKELQLTLKNTQIIELMYAMILVGSVNKGNVHIKDVAAFVKEYFNIDLGDYSHTFHRFRDRNNPTLFLDLMKEKVLEYMNALDG